MLITTKLQKPTTNTTRLVRMSQLSHAPAASIASWEESGTYPMPIQIPHTA
jgi:hypothetical protein